jgi:hypothetical protein
MAKGNDNSERVWLQDILRDEEKIREKIREGFYIGPPVASELTEDFVGVYRDAEMDLVQKDAAI